MRGLRLPGVAFLPSATSMDMIVDGLVRRIYLSVVLVTSELLSSSRQRNTTSTDSTAQHWANVLDASIQPKHMYQHISTLSLK